MTTKITRWGALVLALSAQGCGGAPAAAPARAETAPSPSAAREDRLAAILDELTRPPFGTGAALTFSIASVQRTLVRGTLREGGPAVLPDTPFNLASVSKLVTGAIVLSLVEQGRIELDAHLSRYLPGVTLLAPDGATPVQVTIRELLAHRAGLPHQPGELDPSSFGSAWTDPQLLTRMASGLSVRLVDHPGAYHYSNMGYALLAALVEVVTGQSFADAARSHLDELGMQGATYWGPDVEARGAHGRITDAGGVHFNEPSWYGSRYALPFTGLWASMPDLRRFGRALIGASRTPESALYPMVRAIDSDAEALVAVRRTRLGAPSLEHDGSGPGFLAWVIAIPSRDLVLALACNGGGESAAEGRRFFEITDALLEVLAEQQP